jgi:predicted  nucleic acid-binding Zn-ribbon protein
MADKGPNKELNRKRTQIEISSLRLNLERFELRFMEIEDEKIKLQENIDSTNKRLDELKVILGE